MQPPSIELALGIDFGGTKMLGALVDRAGRIVAQHRVPTPYDGEGLLDAMVDLLHVLQADSPAPVVGIGIGAAGLVDKQGTLRFGPNVGRIADFRVMEGMAERLPGMVIRVDNDNTCATWGERLFGAGTGLSELVYVGLGTGIGGGVVTSGRLLRGSNGFASEFGHATVQAWGEACVCGKTGCWEAYASGRALGRMGREAAAQGKAHLVLQLAGAIDDIRGEHVTRAARQGDAEAIEIMGEFAWWVGLGLANLVAAFDPEAVIIGGGMAEDGDLFLDQTQRAMDAVMFGGNTRPQVPVLAAALGERAGVVGAAMLVFGEEIPEV